MTEQRSISQLATEYRNKVQTLVKDKDKLPADQVLACLVTRDRIAYLWHEKGLMEPEAAKLIDEGDRQLKELKLSISRLEDLKEWRENFNPPKEAWWWHFESTEGWLRRFDWLFTALALIFLTLSAALVTDIAPRFLSGGPDTKGAIIVVAQSAVVLLTTGSVLTRAGQESAKRIMGSFKISKQWWQEIAAVVAIAVFAIMVILRQSLPGFAISYNEDGLFSYCQGNLASAKFNYERALSLNRDYLEAHYNLGQLYEDLQDFEQAKTHYQVAVQGGLTIAYNSLARLQILDENYAAAVPLLLTALEKMDKGEMKAELVRCQPKSGGSEQEVVEVPPEVVKYELLKNLGWVRVEQARYDEAEPYLKSAISLIGDKAPAYCLRAQVLNEFGDSNAALKDWETCLQYASSLNSDEDKWIGIARQQFQTK